MPSWFSEPRILPDLPEEDDGRTSPSWTPVAPAVFAWAVLVALLMLIGAVLLG